MFSSINNTIIKLIVPLIAPILAKIIKKFIEAGCFLKVFNKAIIVLILKANKTKNINDYRPIALVSSTLKILDKIMFKRCVFFVKHHKLPENQFGFTSGKSTSQCQLNFETN